MIGGALARNPRDSRRFIVPSGKVGVSRFRVMERGQSLVRIYVGRLSFADRRP